MEARTRLAQAAEAEFMEIGRRGFQGREFLDVTLIRSALNLRDERDMSEEQVEKQLGLKKGVLKKLGRPGIVRDASVGGMFDP